MTFQIYRLPANVLFASAELKPGWKVSFFLSGTSTPTPVYTTSARNVSHTQPVEADAAGVLPVVYLDPSISYKTLVYDEDDVLQPDFGADPVNDSILSQAGIGEILYPVVPGGPEDLAGVTPTNFYRYYGDIRRYGAAVDGVTDDTAAWQAATDQCAEGGAPVVHEFGTSMAALISYRPGVTYLMGANAVVKCLPNQANFSGRVFTAIGDDVHDSASDSAPVVWMGGIIDGNKANQGTYTGGEKEHNHCIHLGAADTGGRLVARVHGVRFQNATGDGLSIYSNVDVTVSDIEAYKCWRSGVSITGGNVKVRGGNWRLYGDATDASDFDIEVDGAADAYLDSGRIDVELDKINVENGAFEISLDGDDSRVLLSQVNHTGTSATFAGAESVVKISDSVITLGPIDDQLNRIISPRDFTFQNVRFVFSEGSVSATSTFGLDVWFNTGGSTYTDQRLRLINCSFYADSTVDAGDATYGIHVRATAASENNVIELDGGYFDSALDQAYHATQGGKLVIKGNPTINCPLGLYLEYASTNYWDVTVYGPIDFGPSNTSYFTLEQGHASNVFRHFGTVMDEADNVLNDGGGSPSSNTFAGYRTIMFASAPGAATHGNVGDRGMIKAPSANNPVEYVCVTRGRGSGASWKILTTAAA